jgi:pimeloyl-ACP methyl ester carboxylesterase
MTAMPFHTSHAVPVAGGTLHVAQSGPAPRDAAAVVLAVHGITASHQAWRAAVRALVARTDAAVLAPDLRGRGRSAELPPPGPGFAAHVDDMVAVLDAFGVERAVLAGHSMGAYVVAGLAAEHPERAKAVVLVDGGVPAHVKEDVEDTDVELEKALGPSIARLGLTFSSPEQYVEYWQAHPAFAGGWSADLDAYVRADLDGEPGALRSITSPEAVRVDGATLLLDEQALGAAAHVRAPLHVLRAPLGLLADEKVLVPDDLLAELLSAVPDATAEMVEDTNHYTILMGAGAPRVVAAIERALAL